MADEGYDPTNPEYENEEPPEAYIEWLKEEMKPWIEATANHSLERSRRFEGEYDYPIVMQFEELYEQHRSVEALLANVARRLILIGNAMNAERAKIHVRYKGKDFSPFIDDMYDLYVSVDRSLDECQHEMNIIAQKIQSAEQRSQSIQSKRYKRNQMKRYAKLKQSMNLVAMKAENDNRTLSTIEVNLTQLSTATPKTQREILFPKQSPGAYWSGVHKRIATARQQRQANEQERDRFHVAASKRMLDSDEQLPIEQRAKRVMQHYNNLLKSPIVQRHIIIYDNVKQQPNSEASEQMLQVMRQCGVVDDDNHLVILQRLEEIEKIFNMSFGYGFLRLHSFKYLRRLALLDNECEVMMDKFSRTYAKIEQQYSQWLKMHNKTEY